MALRNYIIQMTERNYRIIMSMDAAALEYLKVLGEPPLDAETDDDYRNWSYVLFIRMTEERFDNVMARMIQNQYRILLSRHHSSKVTLFWFYDIDHPICEKFEKDCEKLGIEDYSYLNDDDDPDNDYYDHLNYSWIIDGRDCSLIYIVSDKAGKLVSLCEEYEEFGGIIHEYMV